MAFLTSAFSADHPQVDFDRDIRPLLSDACYQCHGPDEAQRTAELRLDRPSHVFAARDVRAIIVPGKSEQSELYRRISSDDPDLRMPPADADRHLSAEQIELIRRWIEQGAPWDEHWAFVAPERPTLPTLRNVQDVCNPIDWYVRARLEAEELAPSPEADRETLIRRVTLDLTGLPPSPAEVDMFLADESPDAYERLVDRLLASPRYGERMAVPWLDAARYADTSGYQNDGPREMWRWRDWVIAAFNSNMPFDQFTIEQLAGDLLPTPTLSQWIATGFNRNHRGNAEGGIVPEEYAVEYVVDRVETTSTVWLGLTLGCARCHDHKYDPFTQREFYSLYAFFNNVPESGRAIKEGNSPPFILAPTPEQQAVLARVDAMIWEARRGYEESLPTLHNGFDRWQQDQGSSASADWQPHMYLAFHFPLNGSLSAIPAPSERPEWEDQAGSFVPGRLGGGVKLRGDGSIAAPEVGAFGYFDSFTLAAWINPDDGSAGTVVSRMTDAPEGDGYSVVLRDGCIHVNLVKRWLDDAVRVSTGPIVRPGNWQHVAVVYDGSRCATGITIYLNGQPVPHVVQLDALNQSFASSEPFRIGAGGGSESRFRGTIDDVRIYRAALSPAAAESLAVAETVQEILARPAEARTVNQTRKAYRSFVEEHADPILRAAQLEYDVAQNAKAELLNSLPTVMVMQERPDIRAAHVLIRGLYDKPGQRVERDVPVSLAPFPTNAPRDRLGLAHWLVSKDNPLTARVVMNRSWAQFFGMGLVKTTEDFGVQGERPSHPELLDWLATEFQRTGWNIKRMHRLIVTSATYRQSSHVTDALFRRDPENRLLAHGPRYRLSGEALRDQALAASGLLVEEIGGPSVRPYQPAGLWEEISTGGPYEQDTGKNLYRRGLYTYWKRTVAPPAMVTFDASTRETCVVERPRTNTPLQALNLMNDVTFVEAARALAERTLHEAAEDVESRLVYAFKLVTSRRPSEAELRILRDGWNDQLTQFERKPADAVRLVQAGDSMPNSKCDPVELAAYTVLSSLILNLDEAVTKE